MKNLFFLLIAFLTSTSVSGIAVLNPAAPALLPASTFFTNHDEHGCCEHCFGLKSGYRGDFVFNKFYKDGHNDKIHQFEIFSNEAVLALNLWQRVDLYGYIGASNINFQMIEADSGEQLIVNTYTRCIGGIGVKAILWENNWGCYGVTYIGVDGQYEWMGKNPWARLSLNGENIGVESFNSNFEEGQVAVGIAHKIRCFAPYMAVKWSTSKSSFDFVENDRMSTQRHFGYVIGVSIVDIGCMNITGEARFLTETACSIAAEIRF